LREQRALVELLLELAEEPELVLALVSEPALARGLVVAVD
jgi:hypothetical protein